MNENYKKKIIIMKKQLFNITLIAGSTVLAGMINYFYHPIMLRYLSIEEFAEIESLLSLLNLIWVIFTAIALFLVKEMVKNENKINSISDFSFKYLSLFWLGAYVVFLFFTPFISKFLKIDSFYLFAILWLTLFISFAWLYQWAFLQAIWKFKFLSLSNILNAFFRLLFSVGLVVIWLWLFWAVWWLIIGQILMFAISYIFILDERKKYPNEKIKERDLKEDFLKQKKQILHYFLWAIIVAFLMNADILFAKNIFNNTNAWIYAWLSVIWKLVLFVVFSIETVYYPILTKEKFIDKLKILKLSTLYIFVIFSSLAFFYLFWEKVLYIFKPWFEKYLNLVYIILIYCWMVWFISLIIKILTAFKKYLVNYLLLFYLLIFILSMYTSHNKNIYDFSYLFLLNICISLIISLWALFSARKN